jgi:DNA-binding NarL/FixJ family response regulator
MRVILADDSVLFREGLARILAEAGIDVTAQAGDAAELLTLVRAAPPDAVIVDIRMPPTHTDEGLVAALAIRSERPEIGVLVLSHYIETNHAVKLLADSSRGAGYLLKDRVSEIGEFADAVRRVCTGGSAIDPAVAEQLIHRRGARAPVDDLTDREREVLTLMAEGRSNQAICDRLFLSPKTVEAHVRSIFMKLDLPSAPDDHRRVLAVLTHLRSS